MKAVHLQTPRSANHAVADERPRLAGVQLSMHVSDMVPVGLPPVGGASEACKK